MSPLAARVDRFVRWFVNALPGDEIESSRFLPALEALPKHRTLVHKTAKGNP